MGLWVSHGLTCNLGLLQSETDAADRSEVMAPGEKNVQYGSKPVLALCHYDSQTEVWKWRPQECKEGKMYDTHGNAKGLN